MTRVLHIITSLVSGGAERFLVDLCIASSSEDIEYHVISLHDQGDLGGELIDAGISLTALHLSKSPTSLLRANRAVKKYVGDHDIHVIHAHLFHSLLCIISCRWAHRSVKVFFSSHSPEVGGTAREILLAYLKRYRDADITLAEDQRRFFHKDDSIVIHNTVDYQSIYETASVQRKEEIFTFIHVGRLSIEKNQQDLISQFALFHLHCPEAQLWIVGEGPMRENLEAQIKGHGLQKAITLFGRRSDVYELLGRAHAFVLSSLYEGAPLSVLEAAAAHLPVISTKVGIVPDIFSDNKGLLVENTSRIAEKMHDIFDNYQDHMSGAKRLYEFLISHMSYESMIEKYEDAYRSGMVAARASQSKEDI